MALDPTDNGTMAATYPVRLSMVYPERLSRLSTFFRLILIIPVLVFLGLLSGSNWSFGDRPGGAGNAAILGGLFGSGIVAAVWATILIRERIPHWLFDFQVGVHRFSNRAFSYIGLLTDRYPAFEGDWDLQYEVDYPERVSRWRVLFWKLITSIPHFFALLFLWLAAAVCIFIAWFAILFTGAFPRGLHSFVVGVLRWNARVTAYVESLTDAFPPYSLDDDAGPGSSGAQAISAIIGGIVLTIVAAAGITIAILIAVYFLGSERADADYDAIIGGDSASIAQLEIDDVTYTIVDGQDPASIDLLQAPSDARLVAFTLGYSAESDRGRFGDVLEEFDGDERIDRDSVRLETKDDGSVDPVLLTFDGVPAPLDIPEGSQGEIVAIFAIGDDDVVEELRAYPNRGNDRHVRWEFD